MVYRCILRNQTALSTVHLKENPKQSVDLDRATPEIQQLFENLGECSKLIGPLATNRRGMNQAKYSHFAKKATFHIHLGAVRD